MIAFVRVRYGSARRLSCSFGPPRTFVAVSGRGQLQPQLQPHGRGRIIDSRERLPLSSGGTTNARRTGALTVTACTPASAIPDTWKCGPCARTADRAPAAGEA